MWALIVPFLVGVLIGWKNTQTVALDRLLDSVILTTLFLLLLVMGAKLGSDPHVMAQLQEMGVQAITIAAFSVAGSVLAVRSLLRGWLRG